MQNTEIFKIFPFGNGYQKTAFYDSSSQSVALPKYENNIARLS